MPSLERQVCGTEGTHHPGHPVIIAMVIMTKYPSLAAASQPEDGVGCPVALVDGDIPGAGEQVNAALDILACVRRDGPEAAFARATRQWHTRTSRHFRDRQSPGQAQADRFRHRFIELASRWPA